MSVIWHDLECGGYTADLALWRTLAAARGGPVLDVGAGTGRVTLDLARAGVEVTALDHDPDLLAELRQRAGDLSVDTVCADARAFSLPGCFALCLVPMQTIQLLGGARGRAGFWRCARQHLAPGGLVAAAIADELDPFDVAAGARAPLPDVCERDGVVYSSLPTAVRADGDGFVLERERQVVARDGTLSRESDRIHLDNVSADRLEAEARAAGLNRVGRDEIAATEDHVGSRVVMLGV
ncbi:MAG: class I SAM-dependent methyltransferase [Solirubrobacteraceae bacterium]